MFQKFDAGSKEGAEEFRTFFGPNQIDQQVRQAIHFCWMALRPEKRSVEELERQMRRILERALRDLREDEQAFGGPPKDGPKPPQ